MTDAEHSPLKKRIVGAIVLVSLAVIFVPMFLSSERPYDDGMPTYGSNIPAQPKSLAELEAERIVPDVPSPDIQPVDRIPVDEQTPPIQDKDIQKLTPEADADNKSGESKAAAGSQATADTGNSATENKQDGVSGYAVQVASFSSRKNAIKLRDKLRTKSYKSFVEAIKTEKGLRYRVRVGPLISKNEAESVRKRIKQQFRLAGLVVKHP